MVGVRVARRLGVTLGSIVLVALGTGELVTVGLKAKAVELSCGLEVLSSGAGVGEMGGKSAGVKARVGVEMTISLGGTVNTMTLGL